MRTSVKSAAAVAAALMLSSCAGSPQRPVPTVLPDGGRGYSHAGVSVAGESEASVREDVAAQFTYSCNGPFDVVSERYWPETNNFGVPFIRFEAVVRCRT